MAATWNTPYVPWFPLQLALVNSVVVAQPVMAPVAPASAVEPFPTIALELYQALMERNLVREAQAEATKRSLPLTRSKRSSTAVKVPSKEVWAPSQTAKKNCYPFLLTVLAAQAHYSQVSSSYLSSSHFLAGTRVHEEVEAAALMARSTLLV